MNGEKFMCTTIETNILVHVANPNILQSRLSIFVLAQHYEIKF